MPDREYVICARGGTPLREKAINFPADWWLCFPHAEAWATEMEQAGEGGYLPAAIRELLAEAGWKGKEYRE